MLLLNVSAHRILRKTQKLRFNSYFLQGRYLKQQKVDKAIN